MGTTAADVDDDSEGPEQYESFACTSIGGAVGGYNFVDVGQSVSLLHSHIDIKSNT